MNAKEKAKELLDKYMCISYDLNDIDSHKESVVICIDEIIETTFKKSSWKAWGVIPQDESTTEFWQDVKKELELLK